MKDVNFETIWGIAHAEAEDEGTSAAETNFIAWVKSCVAAVAAGIETTTASSNATEVARYSATGMKLEQPTKGLNIIKMSDGSTKRCW